MVRAPARRPPAVTAPAGLVAVDLVLVASAVGLIVHGLSERVAEDLQRAREQRLASTIERERARMVRRVEWGEHG